MNMIPYGRQQVTEEDKRVIIDVLNSDFLTQGPKVSEFESVIKEKLDCQFAIALNSATSALHLSCEALKLGKGDYLWTSPTTFVASANCGKYCSAEVDFVDIDTETGLISCDKLEQKLEESKRTGKLPKIVVAVHLAGNPCDMKRIKSLGEQYKFRIIEDASHALGSQFMGSRIGSCRYSDITVFSFHPVKIITTGEGGMATTNNGDIAREIMLKRTHGITKDREEYEYRDEGDWYYEQKVLGYNYRMNDIEAALGISQLKRLNEIVRIRNKIRQRYLKELESDYIKIIKVPKECTSATHLCIALLDVTETEHKIIFKRLREEGIGVQLHYYPVHLQPFYRKLGYKEGDFINSEIYAKRAISLPVYPGLTEKEQQEVIKKVKEVLYETKS